MWDARCGIWDEDAGYEARDADVGFGMQGVGYDAGCRMRMRGRYPAPPLPWRRWGCAGLWRHPVGRRGHGSPQNPEPPGNGSAEPRGILTKPRFPQNPRARLGFHGSRFPSQRKSGAAELREFFPLLDLAEGSRNLPSHFKTFPPGAILRAR